MSIWRLLSALIVVYLVLLSLRIILSWLRGSVHGRPWELLQRVTDPYLAMFTRLKFLRRGVFDFTPLAALLVLVVALQLVNTMQLTGRITLGVVLAAVIGALWSGLSFLLLFFLILALLRLVLVASRRGSDTPVGTAIAATVEPVVAWVRRFLPHPAGEYQVLIMTAVVLFVARLLGGYLVKLLLPLFYGSPF
ncbi:MAG: YggT family protein [Acidobacteriota bacterium]